MQDFLNPKSMVTPGAAGATMMFLVNGLSVPFPELPARYAALALSFVIGAIAFKAVKLTMVERGIYWVLNSLVIFVVGFGANNLGREASTTAAASVPVLASLIPSAYAQNGKQPSTVTRQPATKSVAKGESGAQSAAEAEKLMAELEALRVENERLKAEGASKASPPAKKESFFRKW